MTQSLMRKADIAAQCLNAGYNLHFILEEIGEDNLQAQISSPSSTLRSICHLFFDIEIKYHKSFQ